MKKYILLLAILVITSNQYCTALDLDLYYTRHSASWSYSLGSLVGNGSSPSGNGLGIGLGFDVSKNLALNLSYEKYSEASPELFAETFGISAVLLNAKYNFDLNKKLSLFITGGANYTFWEIKNNFSLSSLVGELGYQVSTGIDFNSFLMEVGYKVFKSRQKDYMLQTDQSGNFLGYQDLLIDSSGIYVSLGYAKRF
ncbi:MAG: hypothetical protein HQ596_03135 [Candidatus Saganbacteria bacterium]|nr:hypothetical protein [Candidatus Saganbacteria bacterium]